MSQPIDVRLDVRAHRLDACSRQAIRFGRHHLHELTTACQQGIERLRLVVGDRTRLGPHSLSEMGQQRRVQSIGLGKLTRRASEIADLPRIDDGDGNVPNDQCGDDGRLQAAGGLEDDERRLHRFEMRGELRDPGVVVADTLRPSLA